MSVTRKMPGPLRLTSASSSVANGSHRPRPQPIMGRGRGRERLLALLAHFGVRPAGEAALLGRRQAEIRAAAQLLALGHVWHGLREATAAATESR